MKKFFVFFSLMFTVLLFVSCGHKHQANDWDKDATKHWHTCSSCEEIYDSAEHTFGEWAVEEEATTSKKGSKVRECSVCGYEEVEEIPKVEHTHEFGSQYYTDSNYHWLQCECGQKKDREAHKGGQATTEELAVCEVCGKEYGELLPPPHECSFVDGICECGKTQEGAFDKIIDADLSDWSSEELENTLCTFGESGTGFSVVGYHKDGKAYFVTKIVTESANPTSFEIFQKDAATRYVLMYNNETSSWDVNDGKEKLITLYATKTVENGLNVFTVEHLWNFDAFPQEENGNYKIHFAAAVNEKSAASYSDAQKEYWVLYGKNAWDPGWNFELSTTTAFGHAHTLDANFDCVICHKNFKLTDSALTIDGKLDDWNADILDTMLVSYDEEDRWIKQVGFIDDKYLYMYVSVAHRDVVGNLNIIIASNHFAQIASGSAFTFTNIDDASVVEYKDETGSFTVTDYEFVISLDRIREFKPDYIGTDGVRLGFDISNTSGENSYGFACDPNKLYMWAIAGYNSWATDLNFVYGTNGVLHNHDWNVDEGVCRLCPELMPSVQYDITADGDFADWSSEIIATSSKTYGQTGTGWEIMGYRVGTIVYLGVTIKTAGSVPALFGLVESGSAGYAEHNIKYVAGEWVKLPEVVYLGSLLDDTDSIDTYTLELIYDLSSYNSLDSGDYLFGISVNVNEKSAASWSNDNIAYWVMYGRNAWNSDENLFAITESGITHNHILGSEYSYDKDNHWKSCLCGYVEKEAHFGGVATEEKLPVCEACGQPYGELAEHTHNHQVKYDELVHWTECGCGDKTDAEEHRGGQATETSQAICEVCGQPYGKTLGYAIKADGSSDDWSSEVKANALKGWYVDADGKTRGLEYLAFMDEDYIYIYTRTITASNADKGLDIIFNKNGEILSTSLWLNAPGANIIDYHFTANGLLENGLYESVSEMVLDKNAYVNSNGNVFVGIWFMGCDDSFAPLSWHESGKTTIWGLNNRCPWWKGTNHQKVTANGFDHYHDLNSNNVCGWCQETITLPITVDGNSSDWNADILATTKTNGNISAVGFTDDDHVYFYIEVTQTGANEPNYLCIEGTNPDGLRNKTGFNVYFDAGTSAIRPWCNGWWGCVNFCDCDNGYVKYAMNRTTNDAGQLVIQYELVIDKDLIAKTNGEVWVEVAIDDTVSWSSAASLTGWAYMKITENGIEG